MRKTTIWAIAALVFAAALPAAATDHGCVTLEIERHESSGYPYWKPASITWDELEPGDIRYAIVGHFAWFQWGHRDDATSDGDDTISVDLADVDSATATACADGSVTLTYHHQAEPEPAPAPPAPPAAAPEVLDLSPFCELYPESLGRWCELGNLSLTFIFS